MNIFISEGVKLLAEAMCRAPELWVQLSHELKHKTKDITLWTANGFLSLRVSGNDAFNIFEKIYLNNAIKKTIALQAQLAIKEQLK